MRNGHIISEKPKSVSIPIISDRLEKYKGKGTSSHFS